MTPRIEQWQIRVTNPDLMESPKDHPLYDAITAVDAEHGAPLQIPRIGQFFLQGMMNRMGISFHKYGSFLETFPEHRSGVDNALVRIRRYIETGNLEDLIDGANYLLIEFVRPSHPNPYFESEGSETSPGALNLDGTVSHGKVGE